MKICMQCNRIMKPKKIGVAVEELMSGDGAPYKLWMSDLWECPECKVTIAFISDLQKPLAEHYQRDYSAKIKAFSPIARVV